MRRRRGIKIVKELDAFTKVQEDHKDVSSRGGLFSVVAITISVLMVIFEMAYFRDTYFQYTYSVDTNMDEHLMLRFDITVKMPCKYIGADVIDAAGESRMLVQEINKNDAIFDLTEEQKKWFSRKMNAHQRSTEIRTLTDVDIQERLGEMPGRDDPADQTPPTDSCRVHGHFLINKVAGNFHITAGQAVPHIQGHAHINAFVPTNMMNFTHRIDSFTFGEQTDNIIDPLDGTMIGTTDHNHIFQYFLQIVPTHIRTRFGNVVHSHQYSVTERRRHINHTAGSHGLPGIFFKYDLYPLKVNIVEEFNSVIMFLVRLCALVGGVYVTLGLISHFIGYLYAKISKNT